jgi:hypothetical protein
MTSPDTTTTSPTPAAPPPPAVPAAAPPAPWYSRYGNAAQIASAVVALIGFGVVIFQLNDNRKKSDAEAFRAELADARRNYVSYSDSALRYPHLSDPDYAALMHNHTEYVRYQVFVGHLVYAYDDILNVVREGGDAGSLQEWTLGFQMDIAPHRRYLCHPADRRFLEMYRPFMRELLKKAAGDCKDVPELTEVPKTPAALPALHD